MLIYTDSYIMTGVITVAAQDSSKNLPSEKISPIHQYIQIDILWEGWFENAYHCDCTSSLGTRLRLLLKPKVHFEDKFWIKSACWGQAPACSPLNWRLWGTEHVWLYDEQNSLFRLQIPSGYLIWMEAGAGEKLLPTFLSFLASTTSSAGVEISTVKTSFCEDFTSGRSFPRPNPSLGVGWRT